MRAYVETRKLWKGMVGYEDTTIYILNMRAKWNGKNATRQNRIFLPIMRAIKPTTFATFQSLNGSFSFLIFQIISAWIDVDICIFNDAWWWRRRQRSRLPFYKRLHTDFLPLFFSFFFKWFVFFSHKHHKMLHYLKYGKQNQTLLLCFIKIKWNEIFIVQTFFSLFFFYTMQTNLYTVCTFLFMHSYEMLLAGILLVWLMMLLYIEPFLYICLIHLTK